MDLDHNLANQDFIGSASLKDVPAAPDQLTPEALSLFAEGICHILSRWVSLMRTVAAQKTTTFFQTSEYLTQNRGTFMSGEVKQLADEIFIWFAQSEDERKVKSLEYLIQEIVFVRSKFNCSVRDGSTLLVSSKLEMLHQNLMQGNFESIEELRKSKSWIGQDTFDRMIKKREYGIKSSIVKDMKKTSRRHHARRLQLLLSALHISD
ncbi:hypothetical protein MKW98_001571 [Papaver atlanticum]|uniref:Uncharacterized protein n=1 Tax=Papaver atlanticum TaxID=357466 RepID=A0AAD4S8T5_9MAGN|nr:hypothetical protein MKW98_001571 [Papaver atlanticum]